MSISLFTGQLSVLATAAIRRSLSSFRILGICTKETHVNV